MLVNSKAALYEYNVCSTPAFR